MASTTFLLIRHGAHLLGPDLIAGRCAGVNLSPLGRQQAARTAQRIARVSVQAIYSSPIDRCRQTAAILSEVLRLPVQISEALIELDFGRWTRQPLAQLRQDEQFRRWNAHRSGTRMPEGELMLEVQLRIVAELFRLREAHPDQTIALVSHGDVIKAAAAYALGTPLDLLLRIEISPASVTAITWGDYGPWVRTVNSTAELLAEE